MDTTQIYVRNAVEHANDKPARAIEWQPKLLKETRYFAKLLTSYTPKLVFTFGAFAFEFARRKFGEKLEKKVPRLDYKEIGAGTPTAG